MIASPPAPASLTPAAAPPSPGSPQGPVTPAPGMPLTPPKRFTIAPNWLQVVLIVVLLASTVFAWINEWHLRAIALGIGGIAFGASYVLRRMVGDEYGRA